jgi:hypothetical protein
VEGGTNRCLRCEGKEQIEDPNRYAYVTRVGAEGKPMRYEAPRPFSLAEGVSAATQADPSVGRQRLLGLRPHVDHLDETGGAGFSSRGPPV